MGHVSEWPILWAQVVLTMSEWSDITSYSRGERGKVEPRAWRHEPSGVAVHRIHGLDRWFCAWHAGGVDGVALESPNAYGAMSEALDVARARVEELRLRLDGGDDE